MHEFMQEINDIQRQHMLAADYAKTLALLRALKAGKLTLDNVELNDNGWNVVEPQPAQADGSS